MKIGIDGRVLEKGITGTGRYLENLLIELSKLDKENEYFIFSNKKLNSTSNLHQYINISLSFFPHKLFSPLWYYQVLPSLIEKYNINIFLSPNILLPLKKKEKVKFITVVHDVFPFTHKEYYSKSYRIYLSFFLPKTFKIADKIITVSEYSKKEISKTFYVSPDKIEVVYNTVTTNFESFSEKGGETNLVLSRLGLPKKYLLFVGAIEKRKNIDGLIRIMDNLKSKNTILKLVIVGRPNYDSKELIKKLNLRNDYIHCINFVDDITLRVLYQNAFAFIFPSFVEGFGIPPLEAMKLGVPVLSSNTSSLLEVVGEGGLLHDPEDYLGFVSDIIKLEEDNEFYWIMKKKALDQARKFIRKNEARKLLNIFNSITFHD